MHLVDMAEPPRHGGDVDRGVAAADHDHTFAHVQHAAVVEGLQEGGGGDDVGRVAAFHRQGPAALRAQAQEDGIEVGLDLRQRDVGADAAGHAGLHAEVEDALDLGVEHGARRAKAGDAVTHHAAELSALVEDGYRVALLRQLVGRRQTRRTGADDGHLLARLQSWLGEGELVLDRIFAQEVLDRIDADVVFDLVAVAARLTGRRAHAPHHRRQRVGFGQAAPGVFLPGHAGGRFFDAAHDVEVAADVFPRRATALAGRRALDVGGALVGVVGVEDLLLPGQRLGVAVLVAAEGQRLGACLIGVGGHGGDSCVGGRRRPVTSGPGARCPAP